MKQLAPDQIQAVTDILKKPASHALADLEAHKTDYDILHEVLDQERLGKARWQVLNQINIWQAELRKASDGSH